MQYNIYTPRDGEETCVIVNYNLDGKKGVQNKMEEEEEESIAEESGSEHDGLSTTLVKKIDKLIEVRKRLDNEDEDDAEDTNDYIDHLASEIKEISERIQSRLRQMQNAIDHLDELEHSDNHDTRERRRRIYNLDALVSELI